MNTDERDGVRLLAALRDVSPAPPRVDLDAARSEARRRIRRRRLATGGGIIAAVTAVAIAVPLAITAIHREPTPPPLPAEPTSVTCGTPQILPLPAGWSDTQFAAADPTGRFIGAGPDTLNIGYKVAIWDNGEPHELPSDGTTRQRQLMAISSNGTAVGWVATYLSSVTAVNAGWIYFHGRLTELPVAPALGAGTRVQPSAVNNAGTAAGTVDDDTPIVWRNPGAEATVLPLPATWIGGVTGITDDGTVIGAAGPPVVNSDFVGVVWPPSGGYRLLPQPRFAGATAAERFVPFSIRHNLIVGYATSSQGRTAGTTYFATYDLTTRKYTIGREAPSTIGVASINSRLWWVGESPSRSIGDPQPLLISTPRTGVQTFFSPPTPRPQLYSDSASFINDTGSLVVGSISNPDASNREPPSLRLAVWHCH
jgi:hypothetical protein